MGKIRKYVAGLLAATMLSLVSLNAIAMPSAGAITNPSTSAVGTVNTLYWDIDAFWRNNFRSWGWSGYYSTTTVGWYNNSVYLCGAWYGAGAWAGSCDRSMRLELTWNQNLQNRFGDYGVGVVAAHEKGHHIMYDLGWRGKSVLGQELFADCLAGMYTRYGITQSGRLDYSDYWEGHHTLASLAGGTHGTPKNRTDWYNYGYNAYNLNSCAYALRY